MKTILHRTSISKSTPPNVSLIGLFLLILISAFQNSKAQNSILLNPVQFGTVTSTGMQFPGTLTNIQESTPRRGWMKYDLSALNGATLLSANLFYSTASGTVNSTAFNNQLNKTTDDLSMLSGPTLFNRCNVSSLTTNLYTGSWSGPHPLVLQTNGPVGGSPVVANSLVAYLQSQLSTGYACFALKRGNGSQAYNFQVPILSVMYISAGCTGPPIPGSIFTSSPNFVCSGASINLLLDGASSGPQITYQWQVSNMPGIGFTDVLSGGNGTSYNINAIDPGDYFYRVAVTCTSNGQVAYSPEWHIHAEPSPVIMVSSSAPAICNIGDSITYTLNGGLNYTWTPNTDIILHTPDASVVSAFPSYTQTYTVTTVGLNGCSNSTNISVGVGSIPYITIPKASEELLCSGGGVQLSMDMPITINPLNEPCIAGSLAGGCNGLQTYIHDVSFGTTTYTSDCNSSTMYSFSGFEFSATVGSTYPISVSDPNHVLGNQYFVWIDYNHDGVFNTTNEQTILSSSNPAIATITIPSSAYNGATRMRIRAGGNGPEYQLPCGITPNGEVEDYIINISGGLPYNFLWSEGAGQITLLNSMGNAVMAQGLSADQQYTVTVMSPSGCSANKTLTVQIDSFPPSIIADTGLILNCDAAFPPVFISSVILDGKGGFWVIDSLRIRYYDSLGNLMSSMFTKGTVKLLQLPNGGFVVEDSNRVRLYDSNGNLKSTIFTSGTVIVTQLPGGGFIVKDKDRVRLYDAEGNLISTIFTTGEVKITLLPGGGILVEDKDRVRLYGADGTLKSTIFTNGTVKVTPLPGGKFMVEDEDRVRIYDADGNLLSTIFTTGTVKITLLPGGGILIEDEDRVRLFGADGTLKSTIFTNGTVKVTPLPGGKFMVEDEDRVRIYDADGNLLSTIFTTGTVKITLLPGGGILIEDEDRVRLFGADGTLKSTIFTNGTVKVTPLPGGGFIVEDDGRVRLYDADGNLLSTIFTTGTVTIIQLPGGKFIVIDDGRIRLYDANGNLMSTIFTTGTVKVTQVPGGGFIVEDDGRVRLYDANGNLMSTIFTTGTVTIIQLPGGKFIVIDDGRVRLYDANGNLLSTYFTTGTVKITQLAGGKYLVEDDGRVRLYDANGNLLSTIFTTGTTTVIMCNDGGFIVIDDGRVRRFNADGNLQSTIFTTGTTKVIQRTGGGFWVEDDGRLRYYDNDGKLINTSFTQGTVKLVEDGNGGYWLIDSNRVRLYDSLGNLKQTIFTKGEVIFTPDGTRGWILRDSNSVRYFDKNGVQIGSTKVATGGASATDESRYYSLSHTDNILPGLCASEYIFQRYWSGVDLCGHTSTFIQYFYYKDTIAPIIISSPLNLIVNSSDEIPVVDISQVTASDNCSGTVNISWISDMYSNVVCANKYMLTRTYQATDACNNISQVTQNIEVNDTTAPALSCMADTTLMATSVCGAYVNFELLATDNGFKKSILCSETSSTPTLGNCADNGCAAAGGVCIAGDTDKDGILDECGCKKNGQYLLPVIYSIAPGSLFPIGITPVTATATDACGNATSCTFNITVTSPLSLAVDQPVSCHGNTDAAIQATSNGTASYLYAIDGGAFTNNSGYFTGLSAGNHTICVAENGCSHCETMHLTEPAPLQLLLSIDNPAGCATANGQLSASISGGTTLIQPYQVYWYNSIGTLMNPSNSTLTVLNSLSSGQYSVFVEDDHGCSASNIISLPDSGNCNMTLQLHLLFEGYWNGVSLEPVLNNQGETNGLGDCDSIEISLHNDSYPFAMAQSVKAILDTNGIVTAQFTAYTGSKFVVINHRNVVETWSATSLPFSSNYFYDFTTAANKAYGSNQVEVLPGIWAFYSGDINQDDNMDLLDQSILEIDASNFSSGYQASDINGDGNVDLLDYPMLEQNINNFIFANKP